MYHLPLTMQTIDVTIRKQNYGCFGHEIAIELKGQMLKGHPDTLDIFMNVRSKCWSEPDLKEDGSVDLWKCHFTSQTFMNLQIYLGDQCPKVDLNPYNADISLHRDRYLANFTKTSDWFDSIDVSQYDANRKFFL